MNILTIPHKEFMDLAVCAAAADLEAVTAGRSSKSLNTFLSACPPADRPSRYEPLCCVGAGGVFSPGPEFDDMVDDTIHLMTTKGAGQINKATARLKLKQWLKDHHYKPQAPGSASDLSTDTRLDLILSVQTRMRRAEKQYDQDTTRLAKSMYPAWEFTRIENRREPRPWSEVWQEHGGQFYPGPSSYPEGRMIARKDSSIWTEINRFGNNFGPWDFNSGMGTRQVDRDTCIRYRIIRADEFLLKEAA